MKSLDAQAAPWPTEYEKTSNEPCGDCKGPMRVGDEIAAGICCACYWKAHISEIKHSYERADGEEKQVA